MKLLSPECIAGIVSIITLVSIFVVCIITPILLAIREYQMYGLLGLVLVFPLILLSIFLIAFVLWVSEEGEWP